jgi:hypothetical protein
MLLSFSHPFGMTLITNALLEKRNKKSAFSEEDTGGKKAGPVAN